ncbi:hypothetical protein [Algoriphagus yeomjeoni]|uniref:Uncharacterized protein n=1 Tax=Algoriphagus yeomjeoni TaxID=291403 RepID=A0A327NYH2_9BACT|nr:hypothetical protein [Algoriphagus yeomjeoni]RAI84401.1 hypothetical protein LV83_04024 [Algoriphagus yeomjeoni]
MKKVNLIFLALFGVALGVSAQKLQQPLEELPMSNKGYALLKSGQVLEGKILSSSSSRGITQVNLEDLTGARHIISAEEMEEFAIALNGATRLQYLNERGSSLKKLLSKDQPTGMPQDYILFRNTSINGKKEMLLQVLNPDFDEVFEVYYDPFARKTTALEGKYITWTGEKHRAFFISKNGGELMKVKKGKYKKSFHQLFGNCEGVMEIRKPKFRDLENHILLYNNYCLFD